MAMQVTLKKGTLFSRFSLNTISIIKQTQSLPAIFCGRFIFYTVLIFRGIDSQQLIQPVTEIRGMASGGFLAELLDHVRGRP